MNKSYFQIIFYQRMKAELPWQMNGAHGLLLLFSSVKHGASWNITGMLVCLNSFLFWLLNKYFLLSHIPLPHCGFFFKGPESWSSPGGRASFSRLYSALCDTLWSQAHLLMWAPGTFSGGISNALWWPVLLTPGLFRFELLTYWAYRSQTFHFSPGVHPKYFFLFFSFLFT